MARAVSGIGIRFAAAEDVGLLLQLIRELAAYERAPDAVVAPRTICAATTSAPTSGSRRFSRL
jgi:hypothetical protein